MIRNKHETMKTSVPRNSQPGYVSLLAVFTMSLVMLAMTLFAYKRSIAAHGIQAGIQSQEDYREKEETVLRSIIAITPNRAIRAMQSGSNANTAASNPLRWENIFTEALDQSNARKSISPELLVRLNLPTAYAANAGDSTLVTMSRIFKSTAGNTGFVTAGLNRTLGTGFPPSLNSTNALANDDIFPLISMQKEYGALASGLVGLSTSTFKKFNILTYPQINFGYATPGSPFVAKRNVWAFSMDLAEHDNATTKLSRFRRQYALSIYEIPSQLPISAGAFMALGNYANGSAWQNVTISGNVFAGRAVIEGNTVLPSLATRRGSSMSTTSTVGGQNFQTNPFTPGVRETFQLTQGNFFPVSLASESGRAAFIPINRGADFFDRYAHTAETNTISPTSWNNYSVGALQCAMTLDITKCVSASNRTPTELKFTYLRNGIRQTLTLPLNAGVATNLPIGYILSGPENSSTTFPTPVDLAYGATGAFFYRNGVSGPVTFNNATFGDPAVGTLKNGYFRPLYPFDVKSLPNGKICVAVYPERFATFMALLGADSLAVNNSIAVNVDYVAGASITKPNIPCAETDYGVILQECRNLSSFTTGFSLVTNLRLHIGDDFNIVATTAPVGFTPPGGVFYPPASLFAPEKRYGVSLDPYAIEHSGQIGSTAADTLANPIRPLEARAVSGSAMTADRITINLSPITHPSQLPPITMMNWLILIEERRREFY